MEIEIELSAILRGDVNSSYDPGLHNKAQDTILELWSFGTIATKQ